MFAYCGNNPVCFSDPSGYFRFYRLEYTQPNGSRGDRYIYNQEDEPYGSMQFGSSTVGHGGCGPVSVYNSLLLLSRYDVSFNEVLASFELYNFLIAEGSLGSMVYGPIFYMIKAGYDVGVTMDPTQFDSIAESADACILWYMYSSNEFPFVGAHFVAFTQHNNSSTYYNVFSNWYAPYSYSGGCASFVKEKEFFAPILIFMKK